VAREVEDFFDTLDREVYDQFGKGATNDLDPDSPEAEIRRRTVTTAKTLMDLHEEEGETATIARCMDEALRIVAKDQYEKAAKASSTKARTPAGPSVARPSGQASVPGEVDEAKQAREKMVEIAATQGLDMTAE
jgi:hypothetical protein